MNRVCACLGFIVLITALVGPPAVEPAHASEWQELGPAPLTPGPYTGRTSAIIASPTDPNRYYVGGATGGVWRTVDGGTTWEPLMDDMPVMSIGALAMDPFDENVIYAGSGEANFANHCIYGLGLYKSTNGGDSWDLLAGETFAGRTFSRIVVSVADSQVLFASIMHAGGFPARNAAKGHPLTNGPVGVFRSSDGGATWTHLSNGLPRSAASDVWMHPTDANILYAAIGDVFGLPENGIYKSTDGGDSWFKLENGLPTTTIGRISLAVAPSMPDRLYAILTNPTDEFGGGASTMGVYRSDNAGASWSSTNVGNFQATYGWYLSTAIVDPLDPDVLIVGGVEALRSINGGTSYGNVTPPHVDMHGWAYDANHRLLSANDGGVHRSVNNGGAWDALNDGLGVIQFYPGLSASTTQDRIIGGTQDNGTNVYMTETGLLWSHRLGGDGGYTSLKHELVTTIFAENQGSGNLYRSINFGAFSYKGSGIDTSDRNCFLPPVTHDPEIWTYAYYGTHRVYRSGNNGESWVAISDDLTGGAPAAIRALVVAPSNRQVLYAGTNDGRFLVSQNGGFDFDLKLTGIPGWPRVTREIAVDPADEATVYLAVSQFGEDQIRRTTDYGDTWEVLDGNLPDIPVNAVAVYRQGDQRAVILGTDRGVYVSIGEETLWSQYGTGLPNAPVMDVVVDLYMNRLIAGTLGRGAWTIELPRLTDVDIDGDFDMDDLRPLQNCFSGPSDAPYFTAPSPGCQEAFDFDRDGDVDLEDLARYIERLTGPN